MAADPLVLLRQFHSAGKPIHYDAATKQLVFDRVKVPAGTETRFISKRGTPYTAEAIWFLLQNTSLPNHLYVAI